MAVSAGLRSQGMVASPSMSLPFSQLKCHLHPHHHPQQQLVWHCLVGGMCCGNDNALYAFLPNCPPVSTTNTWVWTFFAIWHPLHSASHQSFAISSPTLLPEFLVNGHSNPGQLYKFLPIILGLISFTHYILPAKCHSQQ